jgi:hypothetical protein
MLQVRAYSEWQAVASDMMTYLTHQGLDATLRVVLELVSPSLRRGERLRNGLQLWPSTVC